MNYYIFFYPCLGYVGKRLPTKCAKSNVFHVYIFFWWTLAADPFCGMKAFTSSPSQYLHLCLISQDQLPKHIQTLQSSVIQNSLNSWTIPSIPLGWFTDELLREKLVFSLSIQLLCGKIPRFFDWSIESRLWMGPVKFSAILSCKSYITYSQKSTVALQYNYLLLWCLELVKLLENDVLKLCYKRGFGTSSEVFIYGAEEFPGL